MSWKRWKLGALVSVVLSLIVAGAGVAAGMKWQSFVAVLCTSLLTHFGSFIKDHPVEQISFDTDTVKKTLPLLLIFSLAAALLVGCTVVSADRVFPKLAWYWSKDAQRQRESDKIEHQSRGQEIESENQNETH